MPKRGRDGSIKDFFNSICKRTKTTTKKAILLVGTPGSGKSTVSKLFPDYTVISRDKGIEQGKDWKGAQILFTKEKNDVIRNNKNFIWDTTGLNKNDIVHMINICNQHNYELSIYFVQCDSDITKDRITKREKTTTRKYKINVLNLCNDKIIIERNLNQLYVDKKINGYKIFDNSHNKKLTNEMFMKSCSNPSFMKKLSSKI
tara:strand:- start:183 stop:788 length:606 start_codon:yes stop_codon:yes gene_type:complete